LSRALSGSSGGSTIA